MSHKGQLIHGSSLARLEDHHPQQQQQLLQLQRVENECHKEKGKEKQEEDTKSSRRRKSTICVHTYQTTSLTKRSKSASDLLEFAAASTSENESELVCSNHSDSAPPSLHTCDWEDTAILGTEVVFLKNKHGTSKREECCHDSCHETNNKLTDNSSVEPDAGPTEPISSPTNSQSRSSEARTLSSLSFMHHQLPKVVDFSQLDPRNDGSDMTSLSPDAYIQKLFHSMLGYKPIPRPTLEVSSLPFNATRQPFIPPIAEEHMANYDIDVVAATRDNNLDLLQELYAQGRSLSCCNRYGESLLHMACRRGFEDIVTFLTHDAGVSIRITDDCGRTPLHDALWNRDCQYGIVDGLVRKDPSLLLLCDKRGHTPFEYARREHWEVWKQFLWDRRVHMMQALDTDVMELFRLKI